MNTPLKVVRIFSRLNIGGPSIHVCLLSHYLAEPYETILVTGQVGKDEGNMEYLFSKYNQFKHVYIPELGRNIHIWKDMVALWKIYRLLRKETPHIVHTHTAKAGVLGRLAAVCAGVPIRIHTYHGHVFENYFGMMMTKLVIWVERFLARFTTQIIAISQKQKEDLVSRFHIASEQKITVVPLGFDFDDQSTIPSNPQELKHKHGIPLNRFVVGIVGRLVPIKNHLFFLKVAKCLLQMRSDVHFVIIGEGEMKPMIQESILQLSLTSSMTLIGWQKNLKPFYEMMDVLCLTSLNEGTPVSVIEAQALGIPIVASDVGGIRDVILSPQTGQVISSWDENAFSNQISKILGKKVQVPDAQSKFSRERLLNDIDVLYQNQLRVLQK